MCTLSVKGLLVPMHADLHACTVALQAAYFEQKFVATFFLAPSEGQGAADAAQQAVPRPQRPPSRMGPSRGLLRSSGVRLAPQPDSSALARPEPSNAACRSVGTAAAPCTQIAAMQPEAGHLMQHAIADEDVSSLGSCLSDCGLSDEEGSTDSNQHPQQAAKYLAASQHVRALKDELAAAAAREALLQGSIAARDDTIRCHFMQQELVLFMCPCPWYRMCIAWCDIRRSRAIGHRLAGNLRREKDGMLAMLQSRPELPVACRDSGAMLSLPRHGDNGGADQQEDLAAAHAAACCRVAELEGAVERLEVGTSCWHNRHINAAAPRPDKVDTQSQAPNQICIAPGRSLIPGCSSGATTWLAKRKLHMRRRRPPAICGRYLRRCHRLHCTRSRTRLINKGHT